MLSILPLLGALTLPVATVSLSGSQRTTLQSAIHSVLYSEEIQRFYQQCQQVKGNLATEISAADEERSKLLHLLQQKVHSADINFLINFEPTLTAYLKKNITPLKDCDDVAAFQNLQDSYNLALFSLEIATPLGKVLSNNNSVAASQKRQALQQLRALIDSSHAIGLAKVVDRQLLNALQQANYLHPDYQGRYVFKVQHGWRSNIGQYLGMHIFVSDTDIDKTAKQWLIFLDKNGHYLSAVEVEQASPHLNVLQNANWRYDIHGNLHRNN